MSLIIICILLLGQCTYVNDLWCMCSKSTAAYGSGLSLPQISFKSTTTVLSDKDDYPFFARTCASDSAQGPALSALLMQIGVAPYAAMVSTTDDYASSMSKSFSSR